MIEALLYSDYRIVGITEFEIKLCKSSTYILHINSDRNLRTIGYTPGSRQTEQSYIFHQIERDWSVDISYFIRIRFYCKKIK
jgi:hypothetical protein